MNAKLPLAVTTLCLLVAGCGGGGDGAAPAPAPASAAPAPAPAGTTYAAGTAQASAYTQINTARTLCGFGALAQAAQLDASAGAHANYMTVNSAYGHEEIQGKPGFTGVQFSDRETAAGYHWTFSGEVLAQMNANASGADAMRALLAAPYHAALLLNSYRDIGIAWSPVNGFPTLTADLGTRAGQSLPVPAGVVTYPCAGTTDAVPVGSNESPSPFPSNPNATWGQPIMVRGPSDLTLGAVTITGPTGAVPIQVIYGAGQAPDPNATGDFSDGWFTIIPAPLRENATYSVSINYTTGGTSANRSFSFSTTR